jgi:hypothetical protein
LFGSEEQKRVWEEDEDGERRERGVEYDDGKDWLEVEPWKEILKEENPWS